MNRAAARNLTYTVAIAAVSVAVATVATHSLTPALLTQGISDLWVVQGVLVTGVVSLVYRLQSDLASLGGLDSAQRAEIDELVRKKSRRLWALFFAIAVAALLPRLLPTFDDGVRPAILWAAVFLDVSTALLCFYVPSMWNELRQFLTALVAAREKRERKEAELKRLAEAAKTAAPKKP